MALSLEAAPGAVISSDCINKEARGISITLQIIIMGKQSRLHAWNRRAWFLGLDRSAPEPGMRSLRMLPATPSDSQPVWSMQLPGFIWDGFPAGPGFSVDFDSCWLPNLALGILLLEVLLAFISLFPPPDSQARAAGTWTV